MASTMSRRQMLHTAAAGAVAVGFGNSSQPLLQPLRSRLSHRLSVGQTRGPKYAVTPVVPQTPSIAGSGTGRSFGSLRGANMSRRASDEGVERQDRHSVGAGSKGNRFVPQNAARSSPRSAPYCIAAKRSPLHQRHVVHGVQNNLRDRRHSNLFALRSPNLRDPPQCQGRWDANHPEADGPSPYRNDGPLLRGFGGGYAECGRARLSGVPSKGPASAIPSIADNPLRRNIRRFGPQSRHFALAKKAASHFAFGPP